MPWPPLQVSDLVQGLLTLLRSSERHQEPCGSADSNRKSYRMLGFTSDQISHSVVSNSLRPHESQHTRPPHPSPTPGVHSDSHPSSRWCHPDISSSVVPFSSCPQSLPASESFPMSQLFAWSGQSTGVSALVSFLPKKSQGWSPSEWTGWISLQSKGLLDSSKSSRRLQNLYVQRHCAHGPRPWLWPSAGSGKIYGNPIPSLPLPPLEHTLVFLWKHSQNQTQRTSPVKRK